MLEIGSIILPGNWGRIVRCIGERHPKWNREQLYETVRQRQPNAANLPSRLDASFTCPTEEGLRFYHQSQLEKGNIPAVLYEVEKVDPNASEHLTEFNLAMLTPQGMTDEQAAERYWLGDFWFNIEGRPGFRCEEILTTSAIRIVRRLPE